MRKNCISCVPQMMTASGDERMACVLVRLKNVAKIPLHGD
ncbi:hypothetical protein HMPREF9554_02033 [Treponema phagedenis F0421]|nr:hypothetical protein HMPREF9554_02033 [Treponema phagedenis F0421]